MNSLSPPCVLFLAGGEAGEVPWALALPQAVSWGLEVWGWAGSESGGRWNFGGGCCRGCAVGQSLGHKAASALSAHPGSSECFPTEQGWRINPRGQ